MSNISPDPARHPALVRFWQCFIDKIAGKPNPEKLEKLKSKPWFFRHGETLALLAISFAVLVGPEVSNQVNGIPDPENLQTLKVKILRTHQTEPHLYVEMPDGNQRGMEWPVRISYRGGFRSYVWTDEQRKHLPLCEATVQGAPLRWIFSDRFRIWSLECTNQNIQIGFDKTVEAQSFEEETAPYITAIILAYHLFILVIFLREKRGNA